VKVTKPQARWWTKHESILGKEKSFFSSLKRRDRHWCPSSLLFGGSRASFLPKCNSLSTVWIAVTHLHLLPMLLSCGDICVHSLTHMVLVCGATLSTGTS